MRQPSDSSATASPTKKRKALTPEETAACCFEATSSNLSPDKINSPSTAELLAWFATDRDSNIPSCCLLDVVTTLADGRFLSTAGLGARLLNEFGSIGGVLAADTGRLTRWLEVEGQTNWFTVQLILRLKATSTLMRRALAEEVKGRPIISSWQILLDYLRVVLGNESIEQFRILFLDKKNILIKDEIQQKGTVDHTPLYTREVAKRCLELGASAIIMVHNHPSGDLTPSRADLEITKQIRAALLTLQIAVHDHLIIGRDGHLSLKSRGFL